MIRAWMRNRYRGWRAPPADFEHRPDDVRHEAADPVGLRLEFLPLTTAPRMLTDSREKEPVRANLP